MRMSKKGSVLIASIWLAATLVVVSGSLGAQTSQRIILFKRQIEQFQTGIDFYSALNIVREKIFSDTEAHEDSPMDEWYGQVKLEEPWDEQFSILVEDEESKLNLNYASERQIEAFFKVMEREKGEWPEYKKWIKELIKRREKEPFKSFEELLLLDQAKLEILERLRPYLTVYSEGVLLNINTAKVETLKSLIQSFTGDDRAKEKLLSTIAAYRNNPAHKDIPFRSTDLTPNTFARRLGLEASVEMLQLLNQCVPYLTTDSRYFLVSIKHHSGKEARAVIADPFLAAKMEILAWHEE